MRYFLHLAYNGARFVGWQRQLNGFSVQQLIEESLETLQIAKEVVGCGRTDTGVHAKSYFAHVDCLNEFNLPSRRDLVYRLNAILPSDIRIFDLYPVPQDAHARFSALERTYEYKILRARNPFQASDTVVMPFSLDVVSMQKASQFLIGKADFTSFAKLHGSASNNICTIHMADWHEDGELLIFRITANRFLRNMVRAIVGTMIEIGRAKYPPEFIEQIIKSNNRSLAGASVPANGLSLVDVRYPDSFALHHVKTVDC